MTNEKAYIDPNSGAAPQPGGYAGHAPVIVDGAGEVTDAAVADDVTEAQEKAETAKASAAEVPASSKTVKGALTSI